jgi:hypothetical protein
VGVIVAFNYAAWLALFPEFTSPGGSIPVTEPQATSYFGIATAIHRNDGGGPVNDAGIQTNLLNFLTAHVAALYATPANATSASTLVGRISQAAEGSVNVSVELPASMGASSAFFTQTKYGLMYWAAAAPYRTARYIPNDRNPVNAGTFGSGVGYLGGDNTGYTG